MTLRSVKPPQFLVQLLLKLKVNYVLVLAVKIFMKLIVNLHVHVRLVLHMI